MLLPSDCDIAIIGAGPVGLFMANLMGLAGHRVVLMERNEGLCPLPRAIAFDDEALRSLAQIGLLDTVATGMIASPEVFFRNARGRVLMHILDSPSITGQPRLATFHQPTFEAQLLEGARRFPNVTLLFGANVIDTKQDAAGVTLSVGTDSGPHTLHATYLVACDGGGSATRERIGATLEGSTYAQKWLVIDAVVPGHQVRAITFGCDPARPSVQVPAKGDRLRWEFLQLPGEDEADLTSDAIITRLLRPFGIESLPVIDRKTVYAFHTRIASSWRSGCIFLAGDAAHLMPPFAGQGMNSGFRDAMNLGWKLDHALRGAADDALLDTYEAERKSQVAGIITLSARLGAVIMPLSPVRATVRDVAFFFVNRIRPARRFLERGGIRPPTRLSPSRLVDRRRDKLSGTILPHAEPSPGTVALDTIWGCHQWLALGLGCDPQSLLSDAERSELAALSAVFAAWNAPQVRAGTASLRTEDPAFLTWMRRSRASGVLVRPDRFISARLAPGQVSACLSLVRPPAVAPAPITLGEAA
ncbi:MAG TPA: bifunctional 3-(3-hydroxy-phenyl)propionate/3-hydroxycinnamic acid hydroxylase [Acetobacteraceae bacterium]|nr:bifunctional 3-(3-hydroxy-phenyl)propionate/3-hydroxycinnamic acid hydroxylase [Acetobacteraceae bacterium]